MRAMEEAFPSQARVLQIGETAEGRIMHALEISEALNDDRHLSQTELVCEQNIAPNEFHAQDIGFVYGNRKKAAKKVKPAFVIMGAQHAREVGVVEDPDETVSNVRLGSGLLQQLVFTSRMHS